MKIYPNIKRREIPDSSSETGSRIETKVKAYLEFEDFESNIENFEKIRLAFVKQPKARAVLNFHNSENNSYISLFTMGIIKSDKYKDMTDREL